MSDGNYTFDPNSLSFEKHEPQKGKKFLISLISQILAILTIGIVVFLTISYTIKTPRQKKLEKENEVMQQELDILSEKSTKVDSVLHDIQQRDKDIYRAIFDTELSTGFDNSEIRAYYSSITDSKALIDTVNKLTNINQKRLKKEETTYNELKYKLQNSKEDLNGLPSRLPIADPNLDYTYYGFGKKLDPIYKTPETHYGLDIAASKGTEVTATAGGIVEFNGNRQKNGLHVIINHKNGYKTIYAHLSGTTVKYGQRVKRGELIGFVGNSGKSLTPHLHYEIQYQGQAVNPINYLFGSLKPNKWKELAMASNRIGLCLD